MKELKDKCESLIFIWMVFFGLSYFLNFLFFLIKTITEIVLLFYIPLLILGIVIFIKEIKLFFFLKRKLKMEEGGGREEKTEKLKNNIKGILILRFVFALFYSNMVHDYVNDLEQGNIKNLLFAETERTFLIDLICLTMSGIVRIPFFQEFKKIKELDDFTKNKWQE